MATDMDRRFASKIPWMTFKNVGGQAVPPYSCVSAQSWSLPDISGSNLQVQEPYIQAQQVQAQQEGMSPPNPLNYYITDGVQVLPGGYGRCARPEIFPQLVSVGQASSGGQAYPVLGEFCGPQSGSFQATLDLPGFLVVGVPQVNGYAFVKTYTGLYRAFVPSTINAQSTGSVTPLIEPAGTASSQSIVVSNPYATILIATGSEESPRCTFGWVGGAWEIVAAETESMLRGTLGGILADGGSAQADGADGNQYTVNEVLGLNGGTIPSGKKVWFAFNDFTGQYEVVSAGC